MRRRGRLSISQVTGCFRRTTEITSLTEAEPFPSVLGGDGASGETISAPVADGTGTPEGRLQRITYYKTEFFSNSLHFKPVPLQVLFYLRNEEKYFICIVMIRFMFSGLQTKSNHLTPPYCDFFLADQFAQISP